jgi:hypothetical protein
MAHVLSEGSKHEKAGPEDMKAFLRRASASELSGVEAITCDRQLEEDLHDRLIAAMLFEEKPVRC